jgi:hypothetical protein
MCWYLLWFLGSVYRQIIFVKYSRMFLADLANNNSVYWYSTCDFKLWILGVRCWSIPERISWLWRICWPKDYDLQCSITPITKVHSVILILIWDLELRICDAYKISRKIKTWVKCQVKEETDACFFLPLLHVIYSFFPFPSEVITCQFLSALCWTNSFVIVQQKNTNYQKVRQFLKPHHQMFSGIETG